MISGLLTIVVTATAFGSFLFARSRLFPGTSSANIGALEVTETIPAAASMDHSAWISDGQLHIAGEAYDSQEAVAGWKRLVQVAISDDHLVALDHTGQAYAIGSNNGRQCEIDGQQYITYIAAGLDCTAAVTVDGRIHVYGLLSDAIRQGLSEETNAWKVSVGDNHVLVLRRDGTVAAFGGNESGECDVRDWKNIKAVSAGHGYSVGVTTDGRVRFTGDDSYSQSTVTDWSHITAIAAGTGHIVGIKDDGSVVAIGRNTQGECEVEAWKDITAVAAGYDHTLGVDSAGRAAAVGYNGSGQCDVN